MIRTTLSFRAAWRLGAPHRAGQMVEVDGAGVVRWRGSPLGRVARLQDVREPGGVPPRPRHYPSVVLRWPKLDPCAWRLGFGARRWPLELVSAGVAQDLAMVGRGHIGVQLPPPGVAGRVVFEDFSLTVRRRGGLRYIALFEVTLEVDSPNFNADGSLSREWRPVVRDRLPILDGRCGCSYPHLQLGAGDSVRIVVRGDPEAMRGHRPKFGLHMAVRFEPGASACEGYS